MNNYNGQKQGSPGVRVRVCITVDGCFEVAIPPALVKRALASLSARYGNHRFNIPNMGGCFSIPAMGPPPGIGFDFGKELEGAVKSGLGYVHEALQIPLVRTVATAIPYVGLAVSADDLLTQSGILGRHSLETGVHPHAVTLAKAARGGDAHARVMVRHIKDLARGDARANGAYREILKATALLSDLDVIDRAIPLAMGGPSDDNDYQME